MIDGMNDMPNHTGKSRKSSAEGMGSLEHGLDQHNPSTKRRGLSHFLGLRGAFDLQSTSTK